MSWRGIARRSVVGLRYALAAVMGLWLGDALLLLFSRGGASWKQWLTGIGAALFVAATTAMVLGVLLGPILVPVAERATARVQGGWARLHEQEAEGNRALASVGLALVVLTSIWSLCASRIVAAILYGVARPDTTEFALTLSHVAFAATLVLAWPLGLRAARVAVDAAARMRGGRWLFRSTSRVVACLALPLLALSTATAIFFRYELASVSWLRIAPLVFVVPGVLVARVLPRWRRAGRVVLLGLALVLAGASVAALTLRRESTTAQIIGFDRAMSGRLGYAAWTFTLDFDRDGQISVLGGGDCAPFDSHRHAGATDIPGNGIDEDCDGTDLSAQTFKPRPRGSFGHGHVPDRPSIVLITVDALGGPRLSALGSPVPLMPHVDQLAASSMLFSHCFSQGPSTRLSFPSMFTSRWDSQLVFSYASRLPYSIGPRERQVQDLIDDAGYDTVAIVASSYFEKSRWPSVTRGFQQVDGAALAAGKHNAPQVTDAALRALAEPRARPLYLWVHYYDAHPPYTALPGVANAPHGDEALYDAELGYVDRELGRLLDAIAARPEPTYVLLTSDHSTAFHPNPGSRRFHYGYDLYTATLHVPLIVHGPGIQPGRADDVVSTMDVAPTILDLIRAPEPPQFQGTSLVPELMLGQRDPKRVLFHEFYLPEVVLRGKDPLQIVSVRDDRWDLILDRDRGNYELYDWNADYFEQHDLYESMARTQEAGHLRSLLGSFILQFDNRPDVAALGPAVAPPPEKSEP